jgi:hypothetical protein
MPRQLQKRVSAQSRRIGLLGWVVSLSALPPLASAQSLPPSVTACAAETDALQRLECYDRETARLRKAAPQPETKSQPTPAPVAAAQPAPSSSNVAATTAAGSAEATPSDQQKAAKPNDSDKPLHHFSARVVSIDRVPNEMILHLDNGQTWQEVQAVSGDLSLQEGDTVKIDRQFGSYYLSGPHLSGMKVRQKT